MDQVRGDFSDIIQHIQQRWRESSFFQKNGYYLYTSISFMLCMILILKFFGFDRTPKCSDDLCQLQMLVILFSIAYSVIYIFVLLLGTRIVRQMASFSDQEAIPLAAACAGIGFFVVFIIDFVMIIYSAAAFENWMNAAFYCLLWCLQPAFTLLAVYMLWKREKDERELEVMKANKNMVEVGSRSTVFSAEPKPESTSDYTSLMMISPRLSAALIQQWIDRLCEVETQNNPTEMRKTVREVLQHMNSMIAINY